MYEYILEIYLSGYAASMLLIYILDRTFYKGCSRENLGPSLILSIMSWMNVIRLMFILLMDSSFSNKLNNLWKYNRWEE